ncbi:MAG TPA: hypothetical protein VEH27_17060 [Methylomirabilota bacterium]|nr:hypothetical protein [Methylomirabilota bacterium]
MKTLARSVSWSAVALALLRAHTAQACSVCFGRSDSKLAEGLNWGIFTLLGIVFAVLCAFGVFAFYLAKRSQISPIPVPPPAAGKDHFATQD